MKLYSGTKFSLLVANTRANTYTNCKKGFLSFNNSFNQGGDIVGNTTISMIPCSRDLY